MEAFVARQPIYTKTKEIVAYELLYRKNSENQFPNINGEVATTDVIINSYINIGIEELSSGKLCFINFTEKLLKMGLPTYFQSDEIVVEILESVEMGPDLLEICKDLKSKGYKIALDDFVLEEKNSYALQIIKYADIIKVDFRKTPKKIRLIIQEIARRLNTKLLAEKVETSTEFEWAIHNGYDFFQGYYFSKPDIITTQDVPDYFHNYITIIEHLNNQEPDITYISRLIEQDLSLSYKLLKLINSPAYRGKSKITSIKQAIVRLGFNELKKLLYILSIRGSHFQKNDWSKEMINNSLTRAKTCEHIALHRNKRSEAPSYFLTGMFSLMDTILGMKMEKVIEIMPLHQDICNALIGIPNEMKLSLDLSLSIENGNWENLTVLTQKMGIDESDILQYYNNAFKWSNQLMNI
ncbi:EAL and HDOD domain-containing protein [Niallia sp. Krafla_26]|uniref:EAL and HDOD domain-containing protein n=1 Tax=Niallia sp. Krafla_26 TaxID=3064703 RepID=UPI003D17E821